MRNPNPRGLAEDRGGGIARGSRDGYAIGVETWGQYCGPTGRPQGEQWTSPKPMQLGVGDDMYNSICIDVFIARGAMKNFLQRQKYNPAVGNEGVNATPLSIVSFALKMWATGRKRLCQHGKGFQKDSPSAPWSA